MFIVGLLLMTTPIETPERDNSKTEYCVADRKYSKMEERDIVKKTCKRGSSEVSKDKAGLAERKSK